MRLVALRKLNETDLISKCDLSWERLSLNPLPLPRGVARGLLMSPKIFAHQRRSSCVRITLSLPSPASVRVSGGQKGWSQKP
jgi:hypothetical protein